MGWTRVFFCLVLDDGGRGWVLGRGRDCALRVRGCDEAGFPVEM